MDKPWKVVFAFVGVFIAGAVFGAFFSLRIGGRILQMQNPGWRGNAAGLQNPGLPPSPQQRPNGQTPQPWQAARLMRVYAERLDLTPEQKERIDPLIQRAAEDIRRQMQANFRESGIIMHRLQEDMSKVLTPDQKARLEKMEQRQRELLGRGERGGGGPGTRSFRDGQRSGDKPPPGGAKGAPAGSEQNPPPPAASTPVPPPADGEKK